MAEGNTELCYLSSMNYRRVGQSELMVSEIGFGCMSLGEQQEINERLISRAISLGINYFDTADLYQKGFNEESAGKAVRGHRKNLVLATKVGNRWREDGSGWDWDPSKDYIISSVEKSLRRLQTDYIDLYQLHGGTIEDPIDETIEAFEMLKQQGKIRYYGISSIRPNVIREYVKRSNIVSVMMQYSLLDRRPEESCLDLLKENNIGVLARGTMAGGLLANASLHSTFSTEKYLSFSSDEVLHFRRWLDQAGWSPTSIALHYVIGHAAVCSAVAGIRNEAQLLDVFQSWQQPVPANLLTELSEKIPALRYEQHR